jgi:hypothetical protein
MKLRYSLILTLLLHIATKFVWTLIIAIYQFVKSFIEKIASWARNHFLTSFWTSSLEWKHWPLRCFGKRQKSDGAKSGVYGGCGRISQPQEFKRLTVMAALWGRALSCKIRTPLVNNPGLLCHIASLSLFRVSWKQLQLWLNQIWNQPKELHEHPRNQ